MDQHLFKCFQQMDAPTKRRLAYVTANFKNVFANQDLVAGLQFFEKFESFAHHRSRAHPDAIEQCAGADALALSTFMDVPHFWVSFHYGVYQFLPFRLIQQGISVCLIISRKVAPKFITYYTRALERYHPSGRLCFLMAEDPRLFFQLRQKVHEQFHPFVFADGNYGAWPAQQGNLMPVPLLGATLSVRYGYLRIAALLGLPVHLLLDESHDPQMLSPIRSSPLGELRGNNIRCILEKLYLDFSHSLWQSPYLWEAWYYLHEQAVPQRLPRRGAGVEDMIPWVHGTGYQALDCQSYEVFSISETTYRQLMTRICTK